jgi:hypothetical protein
VTISRTFEVISAHEDTPQGRAVLAPRADANTKNGRFWRPRDRLMIEVEDPEQQSFFKKGRMVRVEIEV